MADPLRAELEGVVVGLPGAVDDHGSDRDARAAIAVYEVEHGFGGVLQTMLASAIAPDGPTDRDREVAELLESIWFSALIGWASGTTADGDTGRIMRRACDLLLPDR